VYHPVRAQTNEEYLGLQVAPAITEQVVSVDNPTAVLLHLTNQSSEAILVTARLEPFLLIRDELAAGSDGQRFDVTAWLSLPENDWLLSGGASTDAEVIIAAQPDTPPGSYYSRVVFRVVSQRSVASEEVTVLTPEVSALLFVTVAGEQVHALQASFVNPPSWQLGSEMTAELEVTNTGNTHEIVRIVSYQQAAWNTTGQRQIEELPFSLILPETTAIIPLHFSFSGLFNRYEVVANVFFGVPAQSLSVQLDAVWMVSYLAIACLLGAVIIIGVLIRLLSVRRRVRFVAARVLKSRPIRRYREIRVNPDN